MARLLRLTLVAVVAVALVFFTAAYAQTDAAVAASEVDLEVVMTQVVHRHGARSGIPRFNTSLICTESPCGFLNWAGIEMMLKTGAFLRQRYNEDRTVVNTPLFPSPNYDIEVSYSRSTDVPRTLQSAEAFLRSFFPNTSSQFSSIHTVPFRTDILLNSGAQPWLRFFYLHNQLLLHKVCNPLTDELYPDWTEITRIGKEIFLEGYCSNYTTRSDCVRILFDIAAAKKAVGELDRFPLLEANFEKLQRITRVLFAYEYRYNRSDPLMFRQGGRGQPMLRELVRNMDNKIAGTNKFKLMHYSTHDISLAPVWGTLGDETDTGMLPVFAQVLVMELLKSKSTGAMHVRILRGAPGQSRETNFVFGWDPTWHMQCMNSWGTAYYAEGNVCPYEDFKRYVRWSEPGDARGYCYLDPDFVAIANCPTENTISGRPPRTTVSNTCQFYRISCPAFACGNGYTLNSVSHHCVCSSRACLDGPSTGITTRSGIANVKVAAIEAMPAIEAPANTAVRQSSGLSVGAVVSVSLATFCVGAAIAAAVTAFVCVCSRRRQPNAADKREFSMLVDGRVDLSSAREA
ncbi:putative membrane-bound acid phosphatase 2 [Leptomonas seymouri]|uniref:Putative membrane-bound acid phosphatase 2 n=1 Tax=Leptomonas seymouri TaxID=5684 RepID=A0A0N0P5Y5_LEPSE|nr:putative membrane-bound acid phosphatase 2 [Leptomonas seymouri]|eukprot:KPI86999.1 putative membrane-bound acid phosphatase 2 [Leptomonas seymouri]